MPEELVTIATFSMAVEADLARAKLESEGIECFLADEHTVTVNWLYSQAVGGVKLQVRESDAQRALEILKGSPTLTENAENHEAENTDQENVRCPRCDSTDVHYEKFSRRLAFLSWLVLRFPLPFLKREWKCKKCGYQWKGSE